MPKRTLRAVSIGGEAFLYPHPVIADRKYLLAMPGPAEAERLAQAVAAGELPHPDDEGAPYEFARLHTDGRTRILKPL